MENLPEKSNPNLPQTLPEKRQSAVVLLYSGKAKAIDVRRAMAELPDIAKALTPVERQVFIASTKTQICEIDDETLVAKTAQMFKFIAIDVGYNIPSDLTEWQYICTRIIDILKKYYSQLTLADIKIAFELATVGELDEYFAKDSSGNPDKKHYQNFNADYFAKILNAYRRKQNGAIHKAYKALPEPNRELTPEQKRYYHNDTQHRCRNIFLRYKYTGQLILGIIDDMFVYDWLLKVGLADNVEASEDDRKQALNKYLTRAAAGFVSKFQASNVRSKGIAHPELDYTAYDIVRQKEIVKTFDRMIADELFIDNYLNFL